MKRREAWAIGCALLPACVLSACGPEAPSGDAPAPSSQGCPFQVDSWLDHPATVITWADQAGNIDYDPPGDAMTRRQGHYDPQTGALSTSTGFAAGHPRVSRALSGWIQVDEAGLLSGALDEHGEDVLGQALARSHQLSAAGCVIETTITDPGVSASYSETSTQRIELVSDDEAHETRETTYLDTDWRQELVHRSDLEVSYTIELADGSYLATGQKHGDGTEERTFIQLTSSEERLGEIEGHFDGSSDYRADSFSRETAEPSASWDLSIQYDGSATGAFSYWEDGERIDCAFERDATSAPGCQIVYTCPEQTWTYDC